MVRDDDGRAQVMDFGLARAGAEFATDADKGSVAEALGSGSTDDSLSEELTQIGSVVGTPGYMAPEQHQGGVVDARSDQYAFCVALWKGLYGELPFRGKDLAAKKFLGPPDPPSSKDVPRWLYAVVARGLQVQPGERWPDMEQLLAALDRDSSTSWRRSAVGVVALGGVAALGVAWAGGGESPCQGAQEQISEVWGEAQSEAVHQNILATDLSYAPETWERVKAHLDRYADDWARMHTDACEATAVRQEQSTGALDLRMRCLHDARTALNATVEVLRETEADTVGHAVDMVASLPKIETCGDLARLEADPKEPTDPRIKEEVDELRGVLARARTLKAAGRYADALDVLEDTAERVRELGHAPLEARFEIDRAGALSSLERWEPAEVASRRGLQLALEHDLPAHATAAANRALWVIAYGKMEPKEAAWIEDIALPLARRAGPDGHEEALALDFLGSVARVRGEFEESAALHERAVEIATRVLGPNDLFVAAALSNAAGAYRDLSRYEDAERTLRRAMAIQSKTLGPSHPRVGSSLVNLGVILTDKGNYDEAEQYSTRGVKVLTAVYGAEHPRVALAKVNLGKLYNARDHHAKAEAVYREVLDVLSKAYPPDNQLVVAIRVNLANALKSQEKYDQARAMYEESLEAVQNGSDPEHPNVIVFRTAMARFALAEGKYDEARAHLDAAIALAQRVLPAKHQDLGAAYYVYGQVAEAEGKKQEALNHYRQSVKIFEPGDGPSLDFAEPAFAIAKLMIDDDPEVALALAERARERLAADPAGDDLRREVVAWIDRRSMGTTVP
jgi:serine/threonine-protein kinase